jgi:hypothetical protein
MNLRKGQLLCRELLRVKAHRTYWLTGTALHVL